MPPRDPRRKLARGDRGGEKRILTAKIKRTRLGLDPSNRQKLKGVLNKEP